MARPAKFDRDNAVLIAMHEIWKNGYGSNSVKSLADRLGITRSSFYNAFGSQEALFREALAKYAEQSPDFLLGLAQPGEPIKPLLTKTFRAACKARANDFEARGCLIVNGVAELCNAHDTLGPELDTMVRASLNRFEQLLEWAVDQGEIDPDVDLHAHALALQNLLMGLNIMCKVVRDESALWATAKTTLQALGLFEQTDTTDR